MPERNYIPYQGKTGNHDSQTTGIVSISCEHDNCPTQIVIHLRPGFDTRKYREGMPIGEIIHGSDQLFLICKPQTIQVISINQRCTQTEAVLKYEQFRSRHLETPSTLTVVIGIPIEENNKDGA